MDKHIYTWKNGNKYIGQFKDGKKHGQGTYTWTSDQNIVGAFKYDEMHGQGTYTHPSGKIEMVNGKIAN